MKTVARGLAWRGASALFGLWGLERHLVGGRRRPPSLGEVRSLLVVRLDLMGDLVFTLPAILSLKQAAPRARLTALVLPYTAELIRGHPAIDRVIAVDVNRWRRPGEWLRGAAWRQCRKALAGLRGEQYDLAVSFYGRVGAAAALLSGAAYLMGYGSEGYLSTFDLALPGSRYRKRRHESEYCLDLVRALRPQGGHAPGQGGQGAGALASGPLPLLTVDPSAAERVRGLLAAEGVVPSDRLVALHPGALNMAAKRWLAERWAVVADRLQMEIGCRVVLVGSPSELPLVEKVRQEMRTPAVMLGGKTTLAELTALLGRCELFLGGDSGPLHVASALGVPSVSVYGPTDPALTGPLGPASRVLRSSADCVPCYDPGAVAECRRGDQTCMAQVSVEEVWEAVREALS